MFHSIISEYDIFFENKPLKTYEKSFGSGVVTMAEQDGKYRPYSFFSTNPADYLTVEKYINTKN